jgi:hypothetical protein
MWLLYSDLICSSQWISETFLCVDIKDYRYKIKVKKLLPVIVTFLFPPAFYSSSFVLIWVPSLLQTSILPVNSYTHS